MSLVERLRSATRPLIIGHRGAMGVYPENTLTSFEHAWQMGADLVELDVHLSRDGALVVIHDERLERTTNGHGFVGQHTVEDLRRLDAGSWHGPQHAGARIPLLAEVLAWARACGALLDIEIKSGPIVYPGIEDALIQALAGADMLERSIVISFDHHAVARVKKLEPKVATGVLYAARPADPVALARAAGADVLAPHWAYVREEDVKTAHEAGLGVAPWVTSDVQIARALFLAGVDALGTNDPQTLRSVAEEFPRH